jgi:hypothetical protein
MLNKKYKIVHHHFNGDFIIINDDNVNNSSLPKLNINNVLIFNIKNNKIIFRFTKIDKINSTDKKIYIDKIEYNKEFPQNIINLFNILGMMNTPTVFYLVYNMDFKVWYLKNNNFTTVFIVKEV